MRVKRLPRLIVAAALLSIGCTSLLGVDDFSSSSEELCDLLDRCYAKQGISQCESHVNQGLDGADAQDRAQWLNDFTVYSCLDQCSNARRCLDLAPVCFQDQQGCSQKEDCCGFIKGEKDCVADRCCRTRGADCDPNATGQCCDSDCSPQTRTCGGILCGKVGDPCLNRTDCCTRNCVGNVCQEEICSEDGFPCSTDEECCVGYCDPVRNVCGDSCRRAGEPCVPGAGECCSDDAPLSCVVTNLANAGVGICSPDSTCLPLGAPCQAGVTPPCCGEGDSPTEGPTTFCDELFGQCALVCATDGESCTVNGQCCSKLCQGGQCVGCKSSGSCSQDGECCSNSCQANVCAPDCTPQSCSHSVFTPGPPLGTSLGNGEFDACPGVEACVKAICETDPFCCCQQWDVYCVQDALVEPSCESSAN